MKVRLVMLSFFMGNNIIEPAEKVLDSPECSGGMTKIVNEFKIA